MESTGLYQKWRPKKLKDVVGQDQAVSKITALLAGATFPTAVGFFGPSGCGKTTLARILAGKLGCREGDLYERNCADLRGIDAVRDIGQQARKRSMLAGGTRVWIIDEAHRQTGEAQDAFLKVLEDAPPRVHFFLCTTHPGKLLPTVRGRCTPVEVRPVPHAALKALVKRVADLEGRPVSDDVAHKIADCADGGARNALVLLEAVLGIDGEDAQLEAVRPVFDSPQGIELARLLMNERCQWAEVAKVLRGLEEDAEAVRRCVLGYAQAILISEKQNAKMLPRAYTVLSIMRYDLFASGKPGLSAACWEVLNRK